jgi:glycosyltransferase involved in cell wall biosynthesis
MIESMPDSRTARAETPAVPPVSAVILTYNEEVNLPECLKSLAGLDCELFVVDSGSTDRTLQIARAGGAKIAEHPFENYAAQRNWAQQNLPLRTEWVLHLDADERLTPELVAEINRKMQQPNPQVAGFLFRKRTIFMGRWMKHGGHYPSFHLRLFRKSKGVCEDRLYDQHFVVDGPVATLDGDYLDVVASNIYTWTLRHARWARLEAQEMTEPSVAEHRVRPDPFGNAIERKRWLRQGVYARAPLFVRPFIYGIYRYFVRLGFLDGKEGLIFHFLQACWYRFLIDCEILERTRTQRLPPRQATESNSK